MFLLNYLHERKLKKQQAEELFALEQEAKSKVFPKKWLNQQLEVRAAKEGAELDRKMKEKYITGAEAERLIASWIKEDKRKASLYSTEYTTGLFWEA